MSRVCIHSSGNEVRAGARNTALHVVSLGATEGGGGAEVAQVVGTVDNGLLTTFQGEKWPLGGWEVVVVMVVMVERLLLERLGVLRCPNDRFQHGVELTVAAFAVGAAVTRLASVAGFARRRGDLWAGRQR